MPGLSNWRSKTALEYSHAPVANGGAGRSTSSVNVGSTGFCVINTEPTHPHIKATSRRGERPEEKRRLTKFYSPIARHHLSEAPTRPTNVEREGHRGRIDTLIIPKLPVASVLSTLLPCSTIGREGKLRATSLSLRTCLRTVMLKSGALWHRTRSHPRTAMSSSPLDHLRVNQAHPLHLLYLYHDCGRDRLTVDPKYLALPWGVCPYLL